MQTAKFINHNCRWILGLFLVWGYYLTFWCTYSNIQGKGSGGRAVCWKWRESILWNTVEYAAAAKSLQSCPTLRDPIDCSLPGSSVHELLQARELLCPPPGHLPDLGVEPSCLMCPALKGGFFATSSTLSICPTLSFPAVSTGLFSTSLPPLLSCKWAHQHRFSRFPVSA